MQPSNIGKRGGGRGGAAAGAAFRRYHGATDTDTDTVRVQFNSAAQVSNQPGGFISVLPRGRMQSLNFITDRTIIN